MLDFLYILGSIGFFALMVVYVRGCEVLGQGTEPEERAS